MSRERFEYMGGTNYTANHLSKPATSNVTPLVVKRLCKCMYSK